MTDRQMLALLFDFYQVQKDVVMSMLNALYMFEHGQAIPTWYALFQWCEARDEREEFWKKFKHHYPDAMALKEGRSFDQY
jgi:hypothetical protein